MVEALSTIVFDDRRVQEMMTVFEEQIKFANSPDEKLRKKTDLFWENTYIRRLLDGDGKYKPSHKKNGFKFMETGKVTEDQPSLINRLCYLIVT